MKSAQIKTSDVDLESRFDGIDLKLHEIDNSINTIIMRTKSPDITTKSNFPGFLNKILLKLKLAKKKKGKLVFSIRKNKEKKKLAILYGEINETFIVKSKLKDGDYIYYQGKFVDRKFNQIKADKTLIAKLLVFLVNQVDKYISETLDEIQKLIIEYKDKDDKVKV